jgi:hypothetical protein
MKQTDLGLDPITRRTRKRILLEEMNQVMPWSDLLSLMAPHTPVAKTGRPPFDLALMLRVHCLQQWFDLSDLGAEEALFETSFYRDFAGISGTQRIQDRVSILRLRHLLEEHELSPKILQVINSKLAAHGLLLKAGTVVDATLNAAPSSTKNKTGEHDPEMHQVKKGKLSLLMRATKAPANGPTPLAWAGMWPYALVSVRRKSTRSGARCKSKPNNSKPACGPRWPEACLCIGRQVWVRLQVAKGRQQA